MPHGNNKPDQLTKAFGVPLQKQMSKQPDGSLLIRGFFTSDNRDEAGDIITRGATERAIPKYREWGNIRLMHLPRPVAKMVRIGSEDGLAWNEIEIKVIDPEAVFMVENGLLTALSVGIMIRFDDIDFLEDGGWVINDYQFAEISLVDHPANYDARLKQLPVDQGLRMLARQYGMGVLATSMKNLIDMEMTMTDQTQEKVDVAEVELSAEQEVQPEVVAEPEVTEVEASIDEGQSEESEDDEVSEVEEEPVVEEEPDPDFATMFQSLTASILKLEGRIAEIKQLLEVQAEAPQAVEQAEDVTEAELSAESDVEPGEPASRESAVPVTELPTDVAEVTVQEEAPVTDLRHALARYFSVR